MPPTILTDMVDAELIELCSYCLVGAATDSDYRDGLTLTAIAVARDLADTHSEADAFELLDAATRGAAARLDASDLDAPSFARALRSLAWLREQVDARLYSSGQLSG